MDKHWINPDLLAPNVLEIDVPAAVLDPLRTLVPLLQAQRPGNPPLVTPDGLNLHIHHHPDWDSDILWITQFDEPTYRHLEAVFDALAIAAQVEGRIAFDERVVLYTTMFVTRSRCDAAHLHFDWLNMDNDAFTFLTPLSENGCAIDLLYEDFRGQPRTYRYRHGKGLIFGSHFHHSTAPGKADEPAVLLAFQFGTDRMDRYKAILKSAYQGAFHRRPDGRFVRSGVAQDAVQAV